MAYDRELADRIRAALAEVPAVREVAMFGTLSFMVAGRLTVGAARDGDLLVRCDPARVDDLVRAGSAGWAEMKGRRMGKGWLVVRADRIRSEEELGTWIALALDHNDTAARGHDDGTGAGRP
jgi:hypothetical protein